MFKSLDNLQFLRDLGADITAPILEKVRHLFHCEHLSITAASNLVDVALGSLAEFARHLVRVTAIPNHAIIIWFGARHKGVFRIARESLTPQILSEWKDWCLLCSLVILETIEKTTSGLLLELP